MTDTEREARLEEIRERLEALPDRLLPPWTVMDWVRGRSVVTADSDPMEGPIYEVCRVPDNAIGDVDLHSTPELIAHAPEDIDWLLSEIDRLREIEEAASDAWREYDREMGLSEDVDAAIDYRELVTDDVDDAMWRLKAKLGEDHD